MSDPEIREAAFMGKITAGATHELKNVLAIIKESAGLLEDLIEISKEQFPMREKFLNVLGKISDQVARGVEISSRLNLFAHAPDNLEASVDLNDVVDQVAFLSKRFARARKITLSVVRHERPILVTTDPLKLQMLVFDCLSLLVDAISMGSGIKLLPREFASGEAGIDFLSDCEREHEEIDLSSSPQWPSLTHEASRLKARLDLGSTPVWMTLGFA